MEFASIEDWLADERYSWKAENLPLDDYGVRQDCLSGKSSLSNWTRTFDVDDIYHLKIEKCSGNERLIYFFCQIGTYGRWLKDTEIESVSLSGSGCHQEADSSLWTCDVQSTGPSKFVVQFNSTGQLNDVVAYYTGESLSWPTWRFTSKLWLCRWIVRLSACSSVRWRHGTCGRHLGPGPCPAS